MKREKVKSSNVKSVGYDEIKKIMEVEFMSGDIYQYLNVPVEVFVAVVTAPSIGSAIHKMLRNKYDFKKGN